jgi:hypothetical protein
MLTLRVASIRRSEANPLKLIMVSSIPTRAPVLRATRTLRCQPRGLTPRGVQGGFIPTRTALRESADTPCYMRR